MPQRTILALLAAGLVALAGCGGDGDDDEQPSTPKPAQTVETMPEREGARPAPAKGTKITLGDSEFGQMLFDSNEQAIYIFENDPKGKSVCYDDCAEAWPPVLTDGEPRAGDGVKANLLGTVERRDGKLQISYAGKPLYFYAHEQPGEVRCHDVNLNGGYWWVVGADGKRRP